MNCLKLLLASLLLTAQLGKGGYASSDPTSYGSEPGVLEVEEPSDAIKVKLLQAWRERAEEKKDRTRDSATLKENLLDIAFEAARSTSETDNDLMPLCLVEAALRDPVYRYIDFASTDRVHEADIRGRVPADFGKMGHFL